MFEQEALEDLEYYLLLTGVEPAHRLELQPEPLVRPALVVEQ